jgi:hypothetical protein
MAGYDPDAFLTDETSAWFTQELVRHLIVEQHFVIGDDQLSGPTARHILASVPLHHVCLLRANRHHLRRSRLLGLQPIHIARPATSITPQRHALALSIFSLSPRLFRILSFKNS